ncbi:peptide/nickel transport system permease protein [Rhodoligotrophos appendicifer]|uniref:ABC transporter permease n=1 Tax=Rhodoligotrophos appendicifer TaxID=987056 RepID=UPI001184D212|nr:ABC transporter permease [Rhodoligotrophos appendicifer]
MVDQTVGQFPSAPGVIRRFFRALFLLRESKIGMLGAFLVLFWIVMAIAAPYLPIADPLKISIPLQKMMAQAPDGSTFWLGTDDRGRDILSRVIWGSRLVLFWASLATIVAYTVGMGLGVVAGYLGGWWDEIISFLANVLLSFPLMVLYLVILTNFGATSALGSFLANTIGLDSKAVSGIIIVVAVTFGTAPQVARIVRGLILDLKTRDYVAAAQVRGESAAYIMLVELLPNARGPLIVDGCLRLGYVTITIALLGYLGLGLPPPDPDWGKMIREAQPMGQFGANAMIWPALAISSLILGLNLLADGLREISLRD